MSQRLDDPLADRIRDTLLGLMAQGHGGATICPSEAARAVGAELNAPWRDLMRPVRAVACELAEHGRIEIVQPGQPQGIDEARGPIRLRLRRAV